MAAIETLRRGLWCIVTKPGTDGTLEVGDHLLLNHRDGTLLCREAHGWLEASTVEAALAGVEVEVDLGFLADQKALLLDQLSRLEQDL